MTRRVCHTPADVASWCRYLYTLPSPITVSWKEGADRTLSQNALLWKWNNEAAKHCGDRTADDVHAANKLLIGVPILREDADFCEHYDRTLGRLTWADQLDAMKGDLVAITRMMTTKQMRRFMDAVFDTWTQRGAVLTLPPPE